MTVTPKTYALVVEKLPDGGFVVSDGFRFDGHMAMRRYASTTIEEALKFIKKELAQ